MRLISTAPVSCNTISHMNPEETPSPSQSQMDNASRALRLQELFQQWAEEDSQLSNEEADRLRLALTASRPRLYPQEGKSPLVLSDELRQELAASDGSHLQLVDEQTGQVYYLIPAERYTAMRAMVAGTAGWDDPAMDVYDNYDEERSKRSL